MSKPSERFHVNLRSWQFWAVTRETFCCVGIGCVFLSREERQVCDSFCANGTYSMLPPLFLSGRWPGEWPGLLRLLFSFDGVENVRQGVLGALITIKVIMESRMNRCRRYCVLRLVLNGYPRSLVNTLSWLIALQSGSQSGCNNQADVVSRVVSHGEMMSQIYPLLLSLPSLTSFSLHPLSGASIIYTKHYIH